MNSTIRYQFAPYTRDSKIACPQCGKVKSFTRYIDIETGNYLPDHVGICDRIEKCGYKYSWWDYVQEESKDIEWFAKNIHKSIKLNKKDRFSIIPKTIFIKSLKNRYQDEFSKFIVDKFGISSKQVLDDYKVGYAKTWGNKNCTVFWQIDQDRNIRSGKIMAYKRTSEDIKRIKSKDKPLINWVHSYYKFKNDFILKQCFFGEHLLKKYPQKKVVIVEGEKTAIICAVVHPDYLWLSSGMLQGINDDKMKPLKGREIVLCPDKGSKAFDIWEKKEKIYKKKGYNIKISRILEGKGELKDGDDIADWILLLRNF